MNTFLGEVSEKIASAGGPAVVIAPNRRALTFLQKELKGKGVRMLTIEEFITGFSSARLATKIELIPLLHEAYRETACEHGQTGSLEELVDFYFWGDMLLKDFDMIDHYCQNPATIFKDLTSIQQINSQYDYLSEEQLAYLNRFWNSTHRKQGEYRQQFIALWNNLLSVYHRFGELLKVQNLGYGGMIYRQVADGLEAETLPLHALQGKQLYFVGFNALTKTEERVLSYFVGCGARVFWDVDAFYLQDPRQEAGEFFRQYQQHPVLGKTFPRSVVSRLQDKTIHVVCAATPVGQVKAMASLAGQTGNPEDTLVVLPDETLLTPVLHSVAPVADHINVTMGYPLSGTPLSSFIELFFETHLSVNEQGYYHRPFMDLLAHPYIAGWKQEKTQAVRKHVLENNWVRIPKDYVAGIEGLEDLLGVRTVSELPGAAQRIIELLSNHCSMQELDKDFLFCFLEFLKKLSPVMDKLTAHQGDLSVSTVRSFVKLLRQLLRAEKIAFEGDPMLGMQVMGVLETRNLDYKNVFILSMNEGVFPEPASSGSYIPYSLRKAYGLPTYEHRDSMYAYLFYRLLQRSQTVYLFYTSSKDALGGGEKSRFIQQLEQRPGINMIFHTQVSTAAPTEVLSVGVEKTEAILDRMRDIGSAGGFSPSALNTYLECELKFFYRYIASLREADFIEEDLDARILGDIVHRCMELMYRKGKDKNKVLTKAGIATLSVTMDTFIDQVFCERFGISGRVEYTGQRKVVKEVVKTFLKKILALDERHAPFMVEGLEYSGLSYGVALGDGSTVRLSGIIDRVDSKGDVLRIIDYKTGKDELNFSDVEELFTPSPTRNKAAFQTLLYAMLFIENEKVRKGMRVMAGLYNRNNLFEDGFEFGLKMNGKVVEDVNEIMAEFKDGLSGLVERIFSGREFSQTGCQESCRVCEFKNLCRKQDLN